MALVRTNVTIPEELLAEVDLLAGPRGRSQFVAEAVAARVRRERLRAALTAADGVFSGGANELSPDAAYAWVRSMREQEQGPAGPGDG
jgi:Arc/MetJ family transcription regulator